MNQGEEDQLRRNDPTVGKKVECDVAAAVEWAQKILSLSPETAVFRDLPPAARAILKLASENAQLREGFNGCVGESIRALRYLAEHTRPVGGEDRFNSLHLHQLADELKRTFAAPSATEEK